MKDSLIPTATPLPIDQTIEEAHKTANALENAVNKDSNVAFREALDSSISLSWS